MLKKNTENWMAIGANGVVRADPSHFGTETFRIPGDPCAIGRLSAELFDAAMQIDDQNGAVRKLILLRSRSIAVISIGLATLKLVRDLEQKPLPGFVVDSTASALSFFDEPIDSPSPSRWRARFAILVQWIALKAIDLLRVPRPMLQVSTEAIEPLLDKAPVWRIRSFPALMGRKRKITQSEESFLNDATNVFYEQIETVARRNEIEWNASERDQMRSFIMKEFRETHSDLQNFRDWFGRRKFSFYGGSVAGYGRALLATVARETGGEAHGTIHGGNVFAQLLSANVVELLNASTFWNPSDQVASNAGQVAANLAPRLPVANLRVAAVNELVRYYKPGEMPEKIRTVAIMGAQAVWRYSAGAVMQAPCYVDAEIRLAGILIDAGYNVIYKAHPENTWRHHDKYLDARVRVDYRKWEDVQDSVDAVLYLFPFSSTLISDLGSTRHVFLIEDGWHNEHWLLSAWKTLSRRCEVVAGEIDNRGRMIFDQQQLLSALAKPAAFDRAAFLEFIGSQRESAS